MSYKTVTQFISGHYNQILDSQYPSSPLTFQNIREIGIRILNSASNVERGSEILLSSKVVLPSCFSWGQKMVALGIMGLGIAGNQVEATFSTNQFPINTFQAGNQRDPAVAGFQGGGFAVTWGSFEQEVDDAGVFAQFFDEMGVKRGIEFQVNSHTDSRQWYPDVVGLFNESAIFAWESMHQDGDKDGIFGQEVDFFGNPVGGEFPVNTVTTDYQELPKIDACPNGDFLITWISDNQDGSNEGIYFQRFDRSRNPVGGETRVHDETDDTQDSPAPFCLANQNALFFWKSRHTGQTEIYGTLFARGGTKIDQDFQVNNQSSLSSSSSLIALPANNANNGVGVVFWESSSPRGVFGQYYDEDGNPIGSEFPLQNISSFEDAARLQNGEYVFASYVGSVISVQRFDQNLNPIGGSIRVNTHPTGGTPKIAALDPEGFVIVWQSVDGDGSGVFGRVFHSNGTAVAIPRTVSGDWQFQPNLASFGNDTVVTWVHYDLEGGYEDVSAQLLDIDGNPLSEEFQVNSNRTGSQLNPIPEKVTPEKFIIRFTNRPPDLTASGRLGQIYDREGCRLGEEFSLDLEISNSTSVANSLVESLGDGNFLSAGLQYDFSQSTYRYSIVFQKYNESGSKIGGIQSYPLNLTGSSSFLVATPIGQSDLAFIWRQSDSGEFLYGQTFSQFDQPMGTFFRIDTDNVATTKRNPTADQLNNLGMVVVWDTWYHPTDDDQGGVYNQRFNSDGTRNGGESRVNSNIAGDQEESSTAVLSDGKYVVVWHSYGPDGSHYGISGQLFLETGVAFGPEFIVNTYTLDSQKFPKVDATGDGGFYVVWQSYQRADNLTRVRGQKFDGDGKKVGPERQFPISLSGPPARGSGCPSSSSSGFISSPTPQTSAVPSPSSSGFVSSPSPTTQRSEDPSPTSALQPSESSVSNSATPSETGSENSSSIQVIPSVFESVSNGSSGLLGSLTETESSASTSSIQMTMMSPYVSIEEIISGEVTVINHPIYGEITLQYDAGTHSLTVDLDLSELENGDEIDLFTFASDFDVNSLNLVVDASDTCMRLERGEDQTTEESDQSVYVIRFVDDDCSVYTGSNREYSASIYSTLLALQSAV